MSKTMRRRIQRDQQIQKRHRERFLAALASGSSPTRAAKQAGIGRSTLYEARRKDREFARAWDDAVMEGIDRLEDEALRRVSPAAALQIFFWAPVSIKIEKRYNHYRLIVACMLSGASRHRPV